MTNEGLAGPSSIDAVTVGDRRGFSQDEEKVERVFSVEEIRSLRYTPDGREHTVYDMIGAYVRGEDGAQLPFLPGGYRDPVIRSDETLWNALYRDKTSFTGRTAWEDGRIYEK